MVNQTIDLLMKHCSIRKYSAENITQEQLHAIIAAGQQASTSSNMQAYSIIRITDKQLRQQFAELSGQQQHVVEAAEFLVWCADLWRIHAAVSERLDEENNNLELTENFIVSTVDAALAAQNSAIAAESMGLGILYVGGIRNKIKQAAELLQLPRYVYPLFGMCIGYPLEEPLRRPRLPLETVLHENSYSREKQQAGIEQYDQQLLDYVKQRSGGKQQFSWSDAMTRRLAASQQRSDILPFLQERGFIKK